MKFTKSKSKCQIQKLLIKAQAGNCDLLVVLKYTKQQTFSYPANKLKSIFARQTLKCTIAQ